MGTEVKKKAETDFTSMSGKVEALESTARRIADKDQKELKAAVKAAQGEAVKLEVVAERKKDELQLQAQKAANQAQKAANQVAKQSQDAAERTKEAAEATQNDVHVLKEAASQASTIVCNKKDREEAPKYGDVWCKCSINGDETKQDGCKKMDDKHAPKCEWKNGFCAVIKASEKAGTRRLLQLDQAEDPAEVAKTVAADAQVVVAEAESLKSRGEADVALASARLEEVVRVVTKAVEKATSAAGKLKSTAQQAKATSMDACTSFTAQTGADSDNSESLAKAAADNYLDKIRSETENLVNAFIKAIKSGGLKHGINVAGDYAKKLGLPEDVVDGVTDALEGVVAQSQAVVKEKA